MCICTYIYKLLFEQLLQEILTWCATSLIYIGIFKYYMEDRALPWHKWPVLPFPAFLCPDSVPNFQPLWSEWRCRCRICRARFQCDPVTWLLLADMSHFFLLWFSGESHWTAKLDVFVAPLPRSWLPGGATLPSTGAGAGHRTLCRKLLGRLAATGRRGVSRRALNEMAVGSKLNRRGKPQVLVHVSTYQGSILVPVFWATAKWLWVKTVLGYHFGW